MRTTDELDAAQSPVPDNEEERLEAVRRYDILDTPPDGAFERITALAARLFDVPISIVSIVDTDRIWFKSHHGLEVDQLDREPGLCASAILNYEPWVLTDASKDPRSLANPLVAGEFGLRFYAGVPLTTHDGYNLGTLCVIDKTPRQVTQLEMQTLEDLASLVMDELELRRSAMKTVALEAELRQSAEHMASLLQRSLLPNEIPSVDDVAISAGYHVAFKHEVGGDFYDIVPNPNGFLAILGDVCGKGTSAASLTGVARWTLRALVHDLSSPEQMLTKLNRVISESSDNQESYCTLALASFERSDNGWRVQLGLGGHPHPLLLRSTGLVETIGKTSPVVGWDPDTTFVNEIYEMERGDTLFMFTDGLFEILGHEASADSTLQRLMAELKGQHPREIGEVISHKIGEGELRDDVAFLLIQIQ